MCLPCVRYIHSQRERELTVVIARRTPTCNTESNANFGNQKTLTLALSQRERELTVVIARHTPTCNTESNANFGNQKPLTLALSRRERELTEVDARATLTRNTERTQISNPTKIGSLSLRERAGRAAFR